ncbi:MAG: hypothetical protein ABIH69_05305 [bacterium]|nr:hypothetical protein [Candidatus Margulisiibacteriota bacterium]
MSENFTTKDLLLWLQLPKVEAAFSKDYQSLSRDNFQAKLDNFFQEANDPLLAAVAGEIGNNSFDHNLGTWQDVTGVYFQHDANERLLTIADRGQGIRKTLSRIIPDIKTDQEAIEIAFIQTISGRSPEQRGNGLKFVAAAVRDNNWELDFRSGNGLVLIKNGTMSFDQAVQPIYGCVAFLKY